MANKRQSKKTPILSEPAEIKPATKIPEAKELVTLTDYYAHFFKNHFDKLDKPAQEELTANLAKPNKVVRGEIQNYDNVRKFVRDVIEHAENEFDKAEAKKLKAAEALKAKK